MESSSVEGREEEKENGGGREPAASQKQRLGRSRRVGASSELGLPWPSHHSHLPPRTLGGRSQMRGRGSCVLFLQHYMQDFQVNRDKNPNPWHLSVFWLTDQQ